ncbi:MAG TPA: hypothetical protein VGY99_14685 [Candidatus Binataceae bacterium]|jgi:hypothetical protein|nr:hypothetical protein [Candidatus Binataceae bacterium]
MELIIGRSAFLNLEQGIVERRNSVHILGNGTDRGQGLATIAMAAIARSYVGIGCVAALANLDLARISLQRSRGHQNLGI